MVSFGDANYIGASKSTNSSGLKFIEVDTSLGACRVVSVLEKLAEIKGLPEVITIDNGPEFASRAVDEWTYRKGVKLNFIRLGNR